MHRVVTLVGYFFMKSRKSDTSFAAAAAPLLLSGELALETFQLLFRFAEISMICVCSSIGNDSKVFDACHVIILGNTAISMARLIPMKANCSHS